MKQISCNVILTFNFKPTHFHQSSNQEAQEDTVCNFIENLVTKSYNEYGEIILQENNFIASVKAMTKMPKWQKNLLWMSFLASAGMFLVAVYLYRLIQERKNTWFPRRQVYSTRYPGADPVSINGRMNSGIIQGRSHSSGHFSSTGVLT
jgi:hypothetical protein